MKKVPLTDHEVRAALRGWLALLVLPLGMEARYAPGDVIAGLERFRRVRGGRLVYRLDAGDSGRYRWRGAYAMAPHQARIRLVVTAVEQAPIQALTVDDIVAAGLVDPPPAAAPATFADAAKRRLAEWWDRGNGRFARYADNPAVLLLRLRCSVETPPEARWPTT